MLRTGLKGKSAIQIAQQLIVEHNNLASLATKSLQTLTKTTGIKNDKAATLLAAFEISRRILQQKKWPDYNKITSPEEIAQIFIPILKDEQKEKFIVVCLNSANRIIKYEVISVGTLNSSVVHPREVFSVAIENLSASILLIHNHPSGSIEPSKEDIAITKKLVESGIILGIPVFDHLIIGENKYLSFIEKGLI